MKYFNRQYIWTLFETLNSSGVDWLLLRNTEDELPDHLSEGKDVDILIDFKDWDVMRRHLFDHSFKQIQHPLSHDTKLYGVHEFENFLAPSGVLLDINFEIAVRSLDQGQWVPLDRSIQRSAWANRIKIDLTGQAIMILGNEDLFVATIARCIFDKKFFSPWHLAKLSQLFSCSDEESLRFKLNLVFFKYSARIFELVKQGRTEEVIDKYLSFSDY
jgi:hypothetical protein